MGKTPPPPPWRNADAQPGSAPGARPSFLGRPFQRAGLAECAYCHRRFSGDRCPTCGAEAAEAAEATPVLGIRRRPPENMRWE